MKKLWIFTLVTVLVMVFSSCGLGGLPENVDTDGGLNLEDTQPDYEVSTLPSETFANTDETEESETEVSETELPLTDETAESEPEERVLQVPAIRENALMVPSLEIVSLYLGQQNPEVDVTGNNYIADCIEYEGQENCYLYTPDVSGTHRFYLADIKHDGRFAVYLYDSAGGLLQSITDVSGGDGINEILEAGQTYRIIVAQYSGSGAYTLMIGAQKPTTEIPFYAHVTEELEFSGQVNNYSFTTTVEGKYRFEVISDDQGIMPLFFVYDDTGNCVAYGFDLPAGGGFSVWLEADSVYTFSVVENGMTGLYQFIVIAPLETLDISEYSVVNNSLFYTEQYHTYEFTASESREYCFGLANTYGGFSVDAEIVDESGFSLACELGMTEGDSITVSLLEGETYTITVAWSGGVSGYSLLVD